MTFAKSLWHGLMRQAYLLLVLTALFWAGNVIAGRLAVGEVSPMAMTSLRWVLAVVILAPLLARDVRKAWPLLRPKLLRIALMGTFGFTVFNALFYAAAYHTTAVNMSIFQASIPVMVLIFATVFLRARPRLVQIVGMASAIAGVVVVAIKGDLGVLRTLAFNVGDVWMIGASMLYAGYTIGLRNRPAVPNFVFFTTIAVCACLTSLPLLAVEIAQGTVQWPTAKGWLILLYAALGPSLISQVFFMRGVELIGAGRAGMFMNLVPVFGALLAVMLLGEPFAPYHAAGLALVLGGIWLAERM
jgi:drug/metabolite transporter (DMT)-like permease